MLFTCYSFCTLLWLLIGVFQSALLYNGGVWISLACAVTKTDLGFLNVRNYLYVRSTVGGNLAAWKDLLRRWSTK
jgi:hypothetical protein